MMAAYLRHQGLQVIATAHQHGDLLWRIKLGF